jgi:hypothetical protein
LSAQLGELNPASRPSTVTLIEQRADTIFGARLEDEPSE